METNIEKGKINIFSALPHQKNMLIGSVDTYEEARRIKREWNYHFRKEGIVAYCCVNKQYNQTK